MSERPAIYVHFEFGVSWTPRHASKTRQVTYMSRSLRDRATEFPRQLPPPNTNFLNNAQPQAEPSIQSQIQNLQSVHDAPVQINPQSQFPRDVVAIHPPQNNTTLTHTQRQIQPQRPPSPNEEWEQLHPRRASRAQSRSSHERGRSAPPPFSNNPWDTNPDNSTTGSFVSNLPRDQRPLVAPEVWKALPATPNQFRLGEDGMPWSSWTFPMGYADDENAESNDSGGHSDPSLAIETSSPTLTRRAEISDREKGKEKEMQSLAAALVTVDNGFEDQWWYQGSRLVHVAGNILPTTSTSQTDGTISTNTYSGMGDDAGWAVSNRDALDREQTDGDDDDGRFHPSWPSIQALTPRSSVVDIVSPMSDFPSPVSGYHGLHRSLTTRSDELHM